MISTRLNSPQAKIGHPLLVRNGLIRPFCHFRSTLDHNFMMQLLLSGLLMVLSWWSQDLVRRPNNQNGQIQKLIFDPYFPLSSPFDKFCSIVQEDVSCWHKQMDVSNEELLPKLYTNIIIFQVCSMAYKCTLRSTCIHATKLAQKTVGSDSDSSIGKYKR